MGKLRHKENYYLAPGFTTGFEKPAFESKQFGTKSNILNHCVILLLIYFVPFFFFSNFNEI